MRKFLFLFLMMLTMGSCVVGAPKAPAKKPLPVWKPAPALLKKLSAPTELPFGTIRLPRGYEVADVTSFDLAGGGLMWIKRAAKHTDSSRVGIIHIPLEAIGLKKITLEDALKNLVKGTERNYSNMHCSPAKVGMLNGRKAIKTDWSGTHRKTGTKVQGAMLVLIDAMEVYGIVSQHGSGQATEKRMTDAAIFTLEIQGEN